MVLVCLLMCLLHTANLCEHNTTQQRPIFLLVFLLRSLSSIPDPLLDTDPHQLHSSRQRFITSAVLVHRSTIPLLHASLSYPEYPDLLLFSRESVPDRTHAIATTIAVPP
ncbi:hypothetical protein B0O80DRAFT_162543 [Mortierella sp. GBAus27b]|nr:hypothetical protein B0O80DRAFT_162543 [Mortierella sp. GBAus27b]